MQGRKDDQGKEQLDLVPSELRYGAARALAYGAEKYARDNWRGGLAWSRLWSALNRHLQAFWDGEDIDPESGLHHLDHAAATLGMLTQSVKDGLGEDDRPGPTPPPPEYKKRRLGEAVTLRREQDPTVYHDMVETTHRELPAFCKGPEELWHGGHSLMTKEMFHAYYEPVA